MPWRGPQEKGEFPSLGYIIADWVETYCIIPDGPRGGDPYVLTDEQLEHFVWCYRLHPDAKDGDEGDAMVYRGDLLVRGQKWGKDPLGATRICAHALGPVVFAGWDAYGEPVAKPHPAPWIVIAALNEKQTSNTYAPVLAMMSDDRLVNTPGLEVGLGEIKLPGIHEGKIEAIPSSAMGRLGGRFTYGSMTESGLLIGDGSRGGGVTFARSIMRSIGGMGGMWSQITNPWDPTEKSMAQRTYEAKAKDVYINYRQPRRRVELNDDEGLLREIIYLYGDSIKERGGWVSARRIRADVQDPSYGEAEVRRFYLQEITGGTRAAVTAQGWAALSHAVKPVEPLRAKDQVALGFDGSRSRDATSLKVCRLRDAALFRLNIWVPSEHGGKVPRQEVHQAVLDAFEAYDVAYLFADPFHWQDYLDKWAGLFKDRVVEFPTNKVERMDGAIQRFLTAYTHGEMSHDDDEVATQHALNAVLVKGKPKPHREGDELGVPEYYLSLAKKRADDPKCLIDDFVAGVLAMEARGYAIERGALGQDRYAPAAARVDQDDKQQPHDFWRPGQRLSDLI